MADQPTITSKNIPGPPVKPPTPPPVQKVEAELMPAIPYDKIVAKPLRAPNFLNLKPRNPNMCLFFGNRAVGEKESGMRYDQLIAMGFAPAEPKDVITFKGDPCPPSLCRDGRIMYGDLILLKIPRVDYVGALKWNEQSARARVKRPGVAIEGAGASKDIGGKSVLDSEGGRASLSPAGFPNTKKVAPYVPELTETDSKTADNSGPTDDPMVKDILRQMESDK